MLIDKYEIITYGTKRYYYQSLVEKEYNLENTTPFSFYINDVVFNETSWSELLRNLVVYLLGINLDLKNKIYDFKVSWSDTIVPFANSCLTNYKKVSNDLFVNCNHTSLHACWFIREFLIFNNIDLNNVKLYIHRSPSSEPKVCINYFETKSINEFKMFLKSEYEYDDNRIDKIIYNIKTFMNPILNKISPSYNNFFLIDDKQIFYNYSKKFLDRLKKERIKEENRIIMNKYINYLTGFYKLM